MRTSKTGRIVGFVGAVGVSAALIGLSVSTTGAYFSDSEDGEVRSTVGSIQITSGDNTAELGSLLPGEFKRDSFSYQNTGTREQDVWLVFDPADPGFQALNDLGGFGRAKIEGAGNDTKFESNNLHFSSTCNDATLCKPIPQSVQLASRLAPGSGATGAFSFGIASAAANQATWSQMSGSLPFTIVATQPGIAPDAAGARWND